MSNNSISAATPFRTIASSIGFTSVALLTAWAGYLLSLNSAPSLIQIGSAFLPITVYVLGLIPYYFSRQVLLERERKNVNASNLLNQDIRGNGLEYPLIIFVAIILLGYFSLLLWFEFPENFRFSPQLDIILGYLLSYIPFILLIVISAVKLNRNIDEPFLFENRTLFPALATGIMPFSFGWSIANSEIDLEILFVGAMYLVLLFSFSYSVGYSKFAIVLISVVVLYMAFEIYEIQSLIVLVYGAIITLSLGVAETIKRLFAAVENRIFFLHKETQNYYLAGANWSNATFPWLLSLAILIIDPLPAYPLLIVIGLQSISWIVLIGQERKLTNFSAIFGVISGFTLLLVIIGYQLGLFYLDWPITYIQSGTSIVEVAVIPGLLFTLGIGLLAFMDSERSFVEFIRHRNNLETYEEDRNVYFLALATIAILILVNFIAGVATTRNLLVTKAIEIIIGLSLAFIIIGIKLVIDLAREREENDNTVNTKGKKKREGEHELVLALRTSRPFSGLVAGLLTFAILLRADVFPLAVSFLLSTPIMLATMIGFIENDIFDYEKDKRARLQRPIASGELSKSTAKRYANVFFVLSLAIALFSNINAIVVLVMVITGVKVYSPFANRFPIAKGIATSILTLGPIAYASALASIHIPLYIYVATSVFIIGREILLDTKDLHRDLLSNLRTLVSYLGIMRSRILAWTLMFSALGLYLLNLKSFPAIVFGLLGLGVLIYSLAADWKDEIKNGGFTILALIFSIMAIPFAL